MDGMAIKSLSIGSALSTAIGAVTSVSGDTLVPLGLVVGGVVLTGVLAFRLGSRLTRIEQKLENVERRLDRSVD